MQRVLRCARDARRVPSTRMDESRHRPRLEPLEWHSIVRWSLQTCQRCLYAIVGFESGEWFMESERREERKATRRQALNGVYSTRAPDWPILGTHGHLAPPHTLMNSS